MKNLHSIVIKKCQVFMVWVSLQFYLQKKEPQFIITLISLLLPFILVRKKKLHKEQKLPGQAKKKPSPPLPLPPRSRSGSDTDTESNEITIRLLAHYNLELSEPKKAVCSNDEIMRQSFVNFMILCSPCSAVTIFSSVNLSSSLDCEDPFLFFLFSSFLIICACCLVGNSKLPFLSI